MKAEIQINADNEEMISCIVEKGQPHDFTIFKRHGIEIDEEVEILGDSGQQGLKKIHTKCRIPFKKTNGSPLRLKKLAEEQKTYDVECTSKN